jgi:UDP-2,4-diacetamido-2,4,6-trideoxy-beta-L-altropyranose hydrolase
MISVVFRADASLQIGTGHVMRCLTLADALKTEGVECHFICREHPGNLLDYIKGKGYSAYAISAMHSERTELRGVSTLPSSELTQLGHAHWLGTSQQQDADECAAILGELQPDWLIVDHYALDACWEIALQPHFRKLMVIDDLADRTHICDVLVDQTYGRKADDYLPKVPVGCRVLCGSQYALLRPEFSALRQYSLKRRETPQMYSLLVNMGGVDKHNATGKVLQALRHCDLPVSCCITVVMGTSAPWLSEVRLQAEQMPWPTDIRVGVSNMAQLMADSDLAIGAAGSTSWERCCLGLPTVMIVLADNQRQVAQGLERVGAALAIDQQQIAESLPTLLAPLVSLSIPRLIMGQVAAGITDGSGVTAVIQHLEPLK